MVERDLVRQIRTYLNSHGVLCWKNHGSVFMQAGLPDIVGVHRGQMIALEVKLPGKKPSPVQKAFIQNLLDHGAWACVVDNLEDAKKFIDLFVE